MKNHYLKEHMQNNNVDLAQLAHLSNYTTGYVKSIIDKKKPLSKNAIEAFAYNLNITPFTLVNHNPLATKRECTYTPSCTQTPPPTIHNIVKKTYKYSILGMFFFLACASYLIYMCLSIMFAN